MSNYVITGFYIAAYLLYISSVKQDCSIKLIEVKDTENGRKEFIFSDEDACKKAISDNEKVDFNIYASCIRNLKRKIHGDKV